MTCEECEARSAILSEQTKAGLARAKGRGVKLGAPVRLDPKIRGRIALERSQGKTLRQIAEGLMADDVRTARGRQVWYASTVRATLKSMAL